MNRFTFLKNLIGLYGIAALPSEMVKQYQKVYLLQSFVRGFQYYEGPNIIKEINQSGLLEMVREPDNKYDRKAIALHFNCQKIGFLPMESNEVLSILMDAKLIELQAEVTHIEPDAADWEKLHIAVYALKEVENPRDWGKAEPHLLLATPRYHTLKSKDDSYTRLYFDQEEIADADDFYETLVDNSSTDEIYDVIHDSFKNAAEMDEAVRQYRFIINRERLPKGLSILDLEQTISEARIKIEDIFEEKGYVVVNVNKIARIPDKISRFGRVLDKQGRYFYEIIFKEH